MQVRYLIMLLLSTISYNVSAQKIIINGQQANRQLTWEDFKGTPDNNSHFFAYTAWNSRVKYDNVQFDGDKAIINGFEMTVEFDPVKSWVKKGKETHDLLKHEQGHFDVAILYMQEVLQKFSSSSFTRNGYEAEFKNLIQDVYKKYVEMGKQYDSETNHSIDKPKQEQWNSFFSEKVKR